MVKVNADQFSNLPQAESAELAGPRSMTDEKVGGPVKNMGGPIKFLNVTMFKILKSSNEVLVH